MRRLADRLVNWLLARAPWYRPDEIEAREGKTELTRRHSINARIAGERALSAELDGAVSSIRRRR